VAHWVAFGTFLKTRLKITLIKVIRHSCEKGAINFLAIFFILNINFNLYNDVFEGKYEFKGQMEMIGILKKNL
jgi:hypothetical protein